MSPSQKLDKRLYAAKIIGIILFITSILTFCANVIAGLMSLFIFPQFNDMQSGSPLFSIYLNWMFRHYTVLVFSNSLICIPLFFSARALFKFKEWGRVACIIMMFVIMILLIIMAIFSFTIYEVPFIFRLGMAVSYIFCDVVFIFGLYFLMRRSIREGISDYNKAKTDKTETAPDVKTPMMENPRYELAKQIVAVATDRPLPKKRKTAALIVAGIMMIAFPAYWILVSLIITLNLDGYSSLFAFLFLIASVYTLLMGITVLWHKKKYRLQAVLANISSIIMLIILCAFMPLPAILVFIGYYIAIIILLLVNYHKFFEVEVDDGPQDTDMPLSPMEMEMQELKILADAKAKGEINETEFEQKAVEIKLNMRTQPVIDTLVKRKNNGMLTEEEFQNKKEQIMLEKQKEVEIETRMEKEKREIHDRRLSLIPGERIEQLSLSSKAKLEKFIDLMDSTDIIVFHDRQIKLIHADRWAAINEAGVQDQFEIILQLQAS